MRTRFDEQLKLLNASLIDMGSLVEHSIEDATKALMEKNVEMAKRIIATDDNINDKEKEIESLCLKIILQQQPVAKDLKTISSALKMITDLERIGDHASDISEITLLLAKDKYIKNLKHLPQMADATTKMLKESIAAFVDKDAKLAQEVIDYDDVVDKLFVEVKEDLIALVEDNVDNVDQAMDFIMIAKYFERIGDHATNIAEWVLFSLTGIHKNAKVL